MKKNQRLVKLPRKQFLISKPLHIEQVNNAAHNKRKDIPINEHEEKLKANLKYYHYSTESSEDKSGRHSESKKDTTESKEARQLQRRMEKIEVPKAMQHIKPIQDIKQQLIALLDAREPIIDYHALFDHPSILAIMGLPDKQKQERDQQSVTVKSRIIVNEGSPKRQLEQLEIEKQNNIFFRSQCTGQFPDAQPSQFHLSSIFKQRLMPSQQQFIQKPHKNDKSNKFSGDQQHVPQIPRGIKAPPLSQPIHQVNYLQLIDYDLAKEKSISNILFDRPESTKGLAIVYEQQYRDAYCAKQLHEEQSYSQQEPILQLHRQLPDLTCSLQTRPVYYANNTRWH